MITLSIISSVAISIILAWAVILTAPKIIDKKNYDEPERLKAAWTAGSMVIPLTVGVIIFYSTEGIGFAIGTAVIFLPLILLNYERFVRIYKLNSKKNVVPITKERIPKRNSLCDCGSGLKYKHCCGKGNK